MPKSPNQKLKLLYILRILWECTDENHGIGMEEIIRRLSAYDIEAERKSIYDDFDMLERFGFDVVMTKNGQKTVYSLVGRDISVGEMKLLVDAVQSSRFLTRKRSDELTEKLTHMLSSYERASLKRQVQVTGRVKMMNEGVLISIDSIHSAISQNRCISFEYLEWNDQRRLVLRKGGNKVHISPWAMVWDNEFYYLLAYDPQRAALRHYRVDKIRHVEIEELPREGRECFEDAEIETYVEQRFSMFAGDKEAITVICEKQFLGPFIDRFGSDLSIRRDGERYRLHFHVAVTDVFFGWLAGLGSSVEIAEPAYVRDRMASFAAKLLAKHTVKGIKNIIFDLGNVLVDFRYRAYMNDLGFDEETADFFSKNIILSPRWCAMDVGRYSLREGCEGFISDYPEYEERIRLFFERIEEIVAEYPDSYGLLKSLREQGYRIYILSNYPDELYAMHSPNWKLLQETDGIVISAKEKLAKPDEELYKLLLRRYELVPEECIFLDDNKANVTAASALGIHGIIADKRLEAFEALRQYLAADRK